MKPLSDFSRMLIQAVSLNENDECCIHGLVIGNTGVQEAHPPVLYFDHFLSR